MLRHTLASTLFAATTLAAPTIQGAQMNRAELQQILACWDQTFAYNGFRLESSEQRFYVSLRGSKLVKEGNFYLSNEAEQLDLGGDVWGDVNQAYHVSFLRADCTVAPNATSLTCAAGDLMVDSYEQSFYRTRKIDDLGTIRDITSRFAVQRLELSASYDGLTLKKVSRFPGTGEIVTQTIAVLPYVIGDEPMSLGCSSTGDDFIPHVAPALVEHLEPR